VQAIGRQPQRAPDGAALRYERHRPEQTTLYRLVQQHAASFIAHTEASTGAELPRFIKDEFEAFPECGILAHGFLRLRLRLRCGECGHDKLLAFSCKRRGFCPSCGARRMSQTAAHLVMNPLEFMQRLAAGATEGRPMGTRAAAAAAPDPFGARVTSLREVSGPPLREPRSIGPERKAQAAGGAAGAARARGGDHRSRHGLRVRGRDRSGTAAAHQLGAAAQACL